MHDSDVAQEDPQPPTTPVADSIYVLEDLLARVKGEELHGEVGTRPSVGNEIW